MTEPEKPKGNTVKSIKVANCILDNVGETLAYILGAKIPLEEKNAQIGLALNDVRISQRHLDNALAGIYEGEGK